MVVYKVIYVCIQNMKIWRKYAFIPFGNFWHRDN